MPAKNRKSSLAWQALEQINMIYHVDNTLKELTPEERKKRRQDSVKPLVEAYFAWVKEKKKDGRIAEKSKTGKDLSFCEDLLPWSPNLPEKCRKTAKK